MLALQVIIAFAVIFVAGMNYALWDNFQERKSLYIAIGCGVIGIYDLISLIGYVTKYNC